MSYTHLTDEELVRSLYASGALTSLELELLGRLERSLELHAGVEEVLQGYEQGTMPPPQDEIEDPLFGLSVEMAQAAEVMSE